MIELETLDELDEHLSRHPGELAGVVMQGLDLTGHTAALVGRGLAGAVFLGCDLARPLAEKAFAAGALVFPTIPELPFAPYRGRLYTVPELYDGFDRSQPDSYARCLDARVYDHFKATGGPAPPSILESLARRLHDHAITDALDELLAGDGQPRKVVAIMGGHSTLRSDPGYAMVAVMARDLARQGFMMASGGGPGAMEATHLGAWLAGRDDDALDLALKILADAPSYRDREWLARAFEVRAELPLSEVDGERFPSLGIPTWLYGHEPPNAFATHVAKYFANSVREDGLLAIAKHGIVFSPGSAGTIQEIFQDACQNHYLTAGVASPMVFFGVDYWQQTKPVYPLLSSLAEGQDYGAWLSITDSPDQVVAALVAFDATGKADG
jgi:predicted Rossmann-fold nucleotide-binding protein